MAVGLGVLKFPPRDFWNMTLPEFRAAQLGMAGQFGGPVSRGMSPDRLGELMETYPDA